MSFENHKTTKVSRHRQADAASRPHHTPTYPRQERYALVTAAREHLHDLWTPCLLEYLREHARHGRLHTLNSLERAFAAYVAKPKRFAEALIRALLAKGILEFFEPAADVGLQKPRSRYGYLRTQGMDWGTELATSTPPAASIPSNENAALVAASFIQGAE